MGRNRILQIFRVLLLILWTICAVSWLLQTRWGIVLGRQHTEVIPEIVWGKWRLHTLSYTRTIQSQNPSLRPIRQQMFGLQPGQDIAFVKYYIGPYSPTGFDIDYCEASEAPGSVVMTSWWLEIPFWFVSIVLLPFPSLWLARLLRRNYTERRRRENGLCATCGYDIRATPSVCPECGMASHVAAPS